ncbi:lipopolysaccharide biosynthesis protein [Rhizorhapis sp. SPR117]|uniref:lipopolysaccharide biosynthesis protein n=1 Tax=Rhizorhapis sp. SPR117 TaxID=2912611 RepID=UPI001F1E3222|nr:lipopolysaccharide biosynthesis protein [Rhizorhapis sp. SPR117]
MSDPHQSSPILRRAAGNAGRLLGGKASAGVMQLGTFAIAARALGATEFGVFSVLIAQVMLFAGLASFESSQAVIRYGVPHLQSGDTAAAQALFKAGTLLDLGAAAALAMVMTAPLFARWLGWDARLMHLAQAAAPLTFAGAIGTSKGMLRLFDRYDLLSWHSIVTPLARLMFIGAAALAGLSLGWYLAAWVIAGWLGTLAAAALAWREAHRRRLLRGLDRSVRGLGRAQPGMWRFALFANLTGSIGLVPSHLATVIVAAVLGEGAAGAYRIGREVATGLLKPIDLVDQAIYPDLARLVHARAWRRLVHTAVRGGAGAVMIFAGMTVLIALAGPWLLDRIFGPAFAAAAPLLVAIGVATTVRAIAFAAEPIVYAFGRPEISFLVSALAGALFVSVLFWRLPRDGLGGAGWAFIVMDGTIACLSALAAAKMVHGAARSRKTLVGDME